MNITTSKTNLEQSFEKLKTSLAMAENNKTINKALFGAMLPSNPMLEQALEIVTAAVKQHISECTEPDPDDLKEVLQPIGDRNLND